MWAAACGAVCVVLLAACGGGGGGVAADASGGAPGPSSPPAAGVYLEAGATATALRPSWVAAVATETGQTPWMAWDALADGDTRLLQGRVDLAAATELQYFDAAGVQGGQADWRQSSARLLRGSTSGLGQALSLQGDAVPDAALLSLAELSGQSWQGHWRHHGPTPPLQGVALDRTLSFALVGGRQVFLNQTLLNCYVDAALSEYRTGQPGLFRLALTLAQVPDRDSCSHAGSYQGLAVALRGAGGGRAQLRLAAIDTPTQRAISYVAQ